MKNKLLAVLATFGMVASASAVKVNNNLSINGFIDSSYSSTDSSDKSLGTSTDVSNIGIDEVELNFNFNAGNVSGTIHIDNNNERTYLRAVNTPARAATAADVANGDAAAVGDVIYGSAATSRQQNDLDIEQVHFTYSFSNGAGLQIGRFASDLGLEREDPAGLYTYSRAYGSDVYNLGNVDANIGEGLRLSYATGDFAASVALFNAVGATEEDGDQEDDLDTEIAVTYTGIENLTLTVGSQTINTSDSKAAGAAATADIDILTANAAYSFNKLLLAGEYISREADNAQDTSAYAVIADYDVTDQLGFSVRYSEWETLEGTTTVQTDKVSFAPNYAISSNLGAIIEFSTEEVSGGTNDGDDVDSLAVELTYTF
jgi:hypothetical protein